MRYPKRQRQQTQFFQPSGQLPDRRLVTKEAGAEARAEAVANAYEPLGEVVELGGEGSGFGRVWT